MPSPAVTPVVFPVTLESEVEHEPMIAHGNTENIWDAVRRAKDPLLAKLVPKVDSLRHLDIPRTTPPPESTPPAQIRSIRRRPSMVHIVSDDGRWVTTIFDVPGVRRADMRIAFRKNHLIVSWRTTHISSNQGAVLHKVKSYERVIPLPEGTEFSEVNAVKETGKLSINYPNSRIVRVE